MPTKFDEWITFKFPKEFLDKMKTLENPNIISSYVFEKAEMSNKKLNLYQKQKLKLAQTFLLFRHIWFLINIKVSNKISETSKNWNYYILSSEQLEITK